MGTYPSPFSCQKTPETTNQYGWVPHGSHQTIPWTILTACINDATLQQSLHYGVIGTLLRPPKGFQDMVHHHCLVPKLIIQGSPNDPVMIPVLHHHKIDPLKDNTPSDTTILNLNGALPVNWMGSAPLPWSSYGNRHPFGICNATCCIQRCDCWQET